ncbi:tRNA (adenosine(37)-N6)-dimethylallyltransferase MiaA [Arenibaculum pallidiluteum]|uniref:tRNA (adenosine(37)-N6)-dimethylallyltransferase MiaA n=1 Tax=Arenibaculum pallidiluteum TaxID=2812559 RepID=UPI001A962F09|nr:tRNA (adenosine(37)-N6)-dimethylallyltransferase MiaA [Arenibaculum pallidiluteum]
MPETTRPTHPAAAASGAGAAAGAPVVVVVGGPTASGKSAVALHLAEALGGTVVNGDSMQVYRELRVLTARPGEEEERAVPHRLYGVLPARERCSAARWRDMALEAIDGSAAAGRLPVVVGGTGLYLRTLMEGIAEIPAIPEPVRAEARARHAALGGPAFHAELAARDPAMAARIFPGDTQRLIRAWEVLSATGRSLAAWQQDGQQDGQQDCGAARPRFLQVLVLPPRHVLYARCDRRFLTMLERGALDEVRALDALDLDPDLPILKALGVPELRAHLRGELPLDAAVAAAQMQTRRYAKRQTTWFRNQWSHAHICHVEGEQESDKAVREINTILREIR